MLIFIAQRTKKLPFYLYAISHTISVSLVMCLRGELGIFEFVGVKLKDRYCSLFSVAPQANVSRHMI